MHAGGVAALAELMREKRTLVLTGAGISTESGIPDYRGVDKRREVRSPMRYQAFVASEAARRRYWARSLRGWPAVARARPNRGHEALTRLEQAGLLVGVITQNVDGLHQAAGSRRVLELHGSLALVRCLGCRRAESRRMLQERLLTSNPAFGAAVTDLAPDGDAEVAAELEERLQVPPCRACGGVLKPDVVFFGENVPRARVEGAWRLYARAELLLVLGSSLAVFSGYRFAHRAMQDGKPLAIVNVGPTRADGGADLRVERRLGEALDELAGRLL